jgi:TonB family protein
MSQRFVFIGLFFGVVFAQETPAKQPAYRVGVGVVEGRTFYAPDPNYTKEALARAVKGTVVLAVRIDEKGCVRDPKVTKPLGYGLDEEALKVVRYWKLKPTLRSGRAVSTKMAIEINFTPELPPSSPVKATDRPCGEE